MRGLAVLAFLSATAVQSQGLVFEGSGHRLEVADGDITGVAVTRDYSGRPAVQFRLSETGAKAFGEMTRALLGQPITVISCGEVLVAPVVREPIMSGVGQITVGSDEKARTVVEQITGWRPCPGGQN